MKTISNKIALVTGASSGIGKSTVELLLKENVKVYAAARRLELMQDLEKLGAKLIFMDLCDNGSIEKGVSEILGKEGSIDILINNAGYGSNGAIEEVSLDEARRQFEVNLFGLARLTQLILPKMRENKYGKIVNITSIVGKMYTPLGGWYVATKHALEGFSDCLRLETTPFGIDTIIVEPGGIATEWGNIASENIKKSSASGPYSEEALRTAKNLDKMYSKEGGLTKSSAVGKLIVKALLARKPKTRYVIGYMAKPALFFRAILSDRMFDRVIKLFI